MYEMWNSTVSAEQLYGFTWLLYIAIDYTTIRLCNHIFAYTYTNIQDKNLQKPVHNGGQKKKRHITMLQRHKVKSKKVNHSLKSNYTVHARVNTHSVASDEYGCVHI